MPVVSAILGDILAAPDPLVHRRRVPSIPGEARVRVSARSYRGVGTISLWLSYMPCLFGTHDITHAHDCISKPYIHKLLV
jgi:hypothetical protein